MLGDQIAVSTGKVTTRRVVSTEPPQVEVSFEETGQVLGAGMRGFGTYSAQMRPDGKLYGQGQGVMTTQDGDMISWKGVGLGTFGAGGAISYRGALFYQTTSQKFAQLNTAPGVFEYEVDGSGNSKTTVWAWK